MFCDTHTRSNIVDNAFDATFPRYRFEVVAFRVRSCQTHLCVLGVSEQFPWFVGSRCRPCCLQIQTRSTEENNASDGVTHKHFRTTNMSVENHFLSKGHLFQATVRDCFLAPISNQRRVGRSRVQMHTVDSLRIESLKRLWSETSEETAVSS